MRGVSVYRLEVAPDLVVQTVSWVLASVEGLELSLGLGISSKRLSYFRQREKAIRQVLAAAGEFLFGKAWFGMELCSTLAWQGWIQRINFLRLFHCFCRSTVGNLENILTAPAVQQVTWEFELVLRSWVLRVGHVRKWRNLRLSLWRLARIWSGAQISLEGWLESFWFRLKFGWWFEQDLQQVGGAGLHSLATWCGFLARQRLAELGAGPFGKA
ncbi:unnamed protein product [Prunus armeniaca]